jgi:hypothetical protein
MKKNYIKEFILRGLFFSFGGPLIGGIIYFILSLINPEIIFNGTQTLIMIVSTLLIAFVHAGTSVFYQIESWSKFKSALWQFIALYLVYTFFYLINDWISFSPKIFIIYTSIFILVFLINFIIVLIKSKSLTKKLNDKIKNK